MVYLGEHLFKKKIYVYSLIIAWSLLSLLILCTYDGLYNDHDNPHPHQKLIPRLKRDVKEFVDDIILKGLPIFHNTEENPVIYEAVLPDPPRPSGDVCSSVVDNEKFDCIPRGSVTQDECNKRGCCYVTPTGKVPLCFYPPRYRSYSYTSINVTDKKVMAEMKLNFNLPYPNVASTLTLGALLKTDNTLIVAVSDSRGNKDISHILDTFGGNEEQTGVTRNVLYDFDIDSPSSGFKIIRKSTGTAIFDSRDIGGFIYSNMLIQLSAKVPCKHIYGLGHLKYEWPLNTDWSVKSLWNLWIPLREQINKNGYGSFPMYLCAEGNGLAHTATFLNFYATEFTLQPGAVTYRTIGAPLVIQFTLGPSPVAAIQQYTKALKFKSIIPPYWALGFHLTRFGYTSLDDIKQVWNKMRAAKLPYDVQCANVDYMNRSKAFTIGENFKGLGEFVEMLHENGMRFIPFSMPAITTTEANGTYPPYDRGLQLDIFVKDSSGKKPLIAQQGGMPSVYPDFTHRDILPYWTEMFTAFHKVFQFDGVTLSLNAPQSEVNGSIDGCPDNALEKPPFIPIIQGDKLTFRTLCMSAKHYHGSHYNVHNLYSVYQSAATNYAMSQIRGKRPCVISYSSTLWLGNYAGLSIGTFSTWEDMALTVQGILDLSLVGVNFFGPVICGNSFEVDVELCRRWYQFGAFSPLFIAYNVKRAKERDPVSLNIVDSVKKAFYLRYSLLPYFYTTFWEANNNGTPVIRPLFYDVPEDEVSYRINTQFMWGDGVMVVPVLHPGHTSVKAYLGKSIWYDIYTNEKIMTNSRTQVLPAPEDTIPVLVKGGSILVMQEPEVTTTLSRQNPFFLKVALNDNNVASGKVYWDDGESIDPDFSTVYFGVINNTLMSCFDVNNYKIDRHIHKIEIFSLEEVQRVTLNQIYDLPFSFNKASKVLTVENLKLDIQTDFNITWFKD